MSEAEKIAAALAERDAYLLQIGGCGDGATIRAPRTERADAKPGYRLQHAKRWTSAALKANGDAS